MRKILVLANDVDFNPLNELADVYILHRYASSDETEMQINTVCHYNSNSDLVFVISKKHHSAFIIANNIKDKFTEYYIDENPVGLGSFQFYLNKASGPLVPVEPTKINIYFKITSTNFNIEVKGWMDSKSSNDFINKLKDLA